jgi:hypothetical protein
VWGRGEFTTQNHMTQEGSLGYNGYNFPSGETLVDMYMMEEDVK